MSDELKPCPFCGGEATSALLEAMEKAATWFRDYERQHRAKLTADGTMKADTNAERAAYLEAAIALARGETGK